MQLLLPETMQVLQSAGWLEERRIAPGTWIDQLECEGYQCNASAVSVLASLGGLTLKPIRINEHCYCPDVITFDPMLAGSGERDRVSSWEKTYAMSLFPIAEVQGGAILCCSPHSVFTLGPPVPLQYIGGDVHELLNLLVCGGRRFRNLNSLSSEHGEQCS